MTVLPLALSLSNSVTEVGAIAAFVALLGIAILSLLVFSQAREIKRLREWAGRSPERAAEMEQRVSADAAARIQRGGMPVGPAAPGAQGMPARVMPRKTPLVSAPVSTAVNATVAAAGLATQPGAAQAGPAQSIPPAQPAATGSPAVSQAGVPDDAIQRADSANRSGSEPAEGVQGPSTEGSGQPPARPTVAPTSSAPEPLESGGGLDGAAGPAPATAAARAAAATPRAPLPPSPSAPAPPGATQPSSSAMSSASSAAAVAAQPSSPASRPPAAAAARSVPTRAVAGPSSSAASRSPSATPRMRGATGSAGAPARTPATVAGAVTGGPKYFKPERRSSGRTAALIAGGVIVGVVALVVAVSALKGGGGSKTTATQSSSSSVASETQTTPRHRSGSARAGAANPGEMTVVVLNGTSTAFLAHHLAADLQQDGYTHASASGGVPPGTHAITVVQYTSGHRADAQAVAKALNVTQVQAIESSTATLAGSPATVVVLAGADQAAQLGGGGAQSKGEPAVGTSGTAAGAAGEGSAGSGQ